MRAAKTLVLGVLLATLGVVAAPPPAGATITVNVGSSTMSIVAVGPETVSFSCVGGNVRVNGQPTSPSLACAVLTRVSVNGDAAAQTIEGDGLDDAAFAADPYLELTLAGGADVVRDTLQADWISAGAGADQMTMKAEGAVNTLVNEVNTLLVEGTSTGDGVYVGALDLETTVQIDTTSGTRTHTFQFLDAIRVHGNGGDDGLSTTDVLPGAVLTSLELDGGDGDDSLLSGSLGTRMVGGTGTNSFQGGLGDDVAVTSSTSDTIGLGAGDNVVVDGTSLRAGGRAVTGTSGGRDTYRVEHPAVDAVVRVRPLEPGGAVTSSLSRTGRQDIGATFAGAQASFRSETNARHLVDVVLSEGTDGYHFAFDSFDDDLLDITVPDGGWTKAGSLGQNMVIDPTTPGIGTVWVVDAGAVSVHGPWPSAPTSFAHRVVRDLLFRFPSESERIELATRVGPGNVPRPTVIAELTDTDEYRGLDVDRIFVQNLRRRPDGAGRAYWIDSIHGGNPLWRVRAQVFGSPEYFTRAGGTNAAYVRAAYADVLGRLPDAAGLQYWVERLEAGVLRSVVAKQFLTVAETRRRIVDDQFLRFLDRKATPAEQSRWATGLHKPDAEQALIRFLAATSTYYWERD